MTHCSTVLIFFSVQLVGIFQPSEAPPAVTGHHRGSGLVFRRSAGQPGRVVIGARKLSSLSNHKRIANGNGHKFAFLQNLFRNLMHWDGNPVGEKFKIRLHHLLHSLLIRRIVRLLAAWT